MKRRNYTFSLHLTDFIKNLSVLKDRLVSYKKSKNNQHMLQFYIFTGKGNYTKNFILEFDDANKSFSVVRKLNFFDFFSICASIFLGLLLVIYFFSESDDFIVALTFLFSMIVLLGFALFFDKLAWRRINKILVKKFNCQILKSGTKS